MPNTYYVDDGGGAPNDGSSWAAAYTSLSALDDAVTLASGDIVYIGHDHNCQYSHSGGRTITGPASGLPCTIISATTGSDPPTYAVGTGLQVDTSEGAHRLTFSGSFALYGLKMKTGEHLVFTPDSDTTFLAVDCTHLPAASGVFRANASASGHVEIRNMTVDLTAESGGGSQTAIPIQPLASQGTVNITGLTLANGSKRTGAVFGNNAANGVACVSGADVSSCTSATECELVDLSTCTGSFTLNNCKTKSGFVPFIGTPLSACNVMITNCGPSDDPTYLAHATGRGTVISSTDVYRTGGAKIEGTPVSWLVTTQALCSEHSPYHSPWIYGLLTSSGSKTFDVYIVSDHADLDDSEIWLEVETMDGSNVGQYVLHRDQRANNTGAFVSILTAAVAQTDDTTSTWTGGSPSPLFTYKQKLSVTATVNESEGLYRARVAVAHTSVTAAFKLYIDPLVTVT